MPAQPKHVYWNSRLVGTVGTPWYNFPQGWHYGWITKDSEAFDLALAAYCQFEKTGENHPDIKMSEHPSEKLHYMGHDVIVFTT